MCNWVTNVETIAVKNHHFNLEESQKVHIFRGCKTWSLDFGKN